MRPWHPPNAQCSPPDMPMRKAWVPQHPMHLLNTHRLLIHHMSFSTKGGRNQPLQLSGQKVFLDIYQNYNGIDIHRVWQYNHGARLFVKLLSGSTCCQMQSIKLKITSILGGMWRYVMVSINKHGDCRMLGSVHGPEKKISAMRISQSQ